MAKWIAKEWNVSNQPNQNGNYIEITAGQKGLFAWVLEKMGIDATKTMKVDGEDLIVEEGSLRGQVRTVVPLKKISQTESGYTKPFTTAVVLAAAGLPLFVVGALIGVAYYIFNKQLTVGFKGSGGVNISLDLATKSLGGKELTEQDAEQVSRTVQHLVRNSGSKQTSPPQLPNQQSSNSRQNAPQNQRAARV
mgnify:CR=1 FL=1